eukprot:6162821-Prymnesium_polylepis.1
MPTSTLQDLHEVLQRHAVAKRDGRFRLTARDVALWAVREVPPQVQVLGPIPRLYLRALDKNPHGWLHLGVAVVEHCRRGGGPTDWPNCIVPEHARSQWEHARSQREHTRSQREHTRSQREHARSQRQHARSQWEHAWPHSGSTRGRCGRGVSAKFASSSHPGGTRACCARAATRLWAPCGSARRPRSNSGRTLAA